MPAADPDLPTFARHLERSRLVAAGNVTRLLACQTLASSAADHLVSAGILTRYQADKLLEGRWQGLVLGAYRILHPVGRGGMGVVYLASREGAADPVALKILPPAKAATQPRSLARFKREMRIGRIVPRHTNVVATLDSGVVDGVHFLAMEYAPGRTLRNRVTNHGALAAEPAARLFARAAAGLAAVHSVGVVHRDVSPANLIVTPAGDVRLLDFGVAIVTGEPLPDDPTVAGGAGYTMGTMDYIAPEQVRNAAAATPASDLYALGCSLYFALAGTPPYPGGNSRQKLHWHKRAEAPPVSAINPLVPAALSRYVERLMAKAPADRPATAAEVARDLQAFASDESDPVAVTLPDDADEKDAEEIDFDNPSDVRPPANRVVWGLIAFFAVVLVGLLVVLVMLMTRK